MILFSAVPNSPPQLVPAAGGEPRSVPVEGVERGFRSFPRFLPDGRRYIYERLDGSDRWEYSRRRSTPLRCASWSTREATAWYVTGGCSICRAPLLLFSPSTRRHSSLRGTPATIAEGVGFNAITYPALFRLRRCGRVPRHDPRRAAGLVRPPGPRLGAVTPPGDYSTLCLTENERGVVFEEADPAGGR